MESVFHPSLNRPKLVLGIGASAFGFEVTLVVVAANLQSIPLAAAICVLHLLLRWQYRKDAFFLPALKSYLKESDLYDPWVREPVMRRRPRGWGRELHC